MNFMLALLSIIIEKFITMKKKVCVVGAGLSGLVTVKELIDEGHNVFCYEKSEEIGGVFRKKLTPYYQSLHLTVSNHFMAFSSFPAKDKNRKFWSAAEYFNYLKSFVECFNLSRCIYLNHQVEDIQPIDNNQKFIIKVSHNNKVEDLVFDAVAICNGVHQKPSRPKFEGEQEYTGKILHGRDLLQKNISLQGKKVACVGIGETGAELTHLISKQAKQCTLSIRRYQAILERYPLGRNHSSDTYTCRALYQIPYTFLNQIFYQLGEKNSKMGSNSIQGLLGEWTIKSGGNHSQFQTKNEIFLKGILDGKIALNSSGIKALSGQKIIFQNGQSVEADYIICNTGYKVSIPFMSDFNETKIRDLYLHMFHENFGSNIALIGFARPAVGSLPTCSELQSRFFALLCSDKKQLPPIKERIEKTRQEASIERQQFHLCPSMETLVHYSGYTDKLAKLIGCLPSYWWWSVRPRLFIRFWFGSQLSYHYRLTGPHAITQQSAKVIKSLPLAWQPKEMFLLFSLAIFSKFKKYKNLAFSKLAFPLIKSATQKQKKNDN